MTRVKPANEAGARIGRIVRGWRIDQGIDQPTLARMTGLSQEYISKLERGLSADPGISRVIRIAQALGHTVPELLEAAGLIERENGKS